MKGSTSEAGSRTSAAVAPVAPGVLPPSVLAPATDVEPIPAQTDQHDDRGDPCHRYLRRRPAFTPDTAPSRTGLRVRSLVPTPNAALRAHRVTPIVRRINLSLTDWVTTDYDEGCP